MEDIAGKGLVCKEKRGGENSDRYADHVTVLSTTHAPTRMVLRTLYHERKTKGMALVPDFSSHL